MNLSINDSLNFISKLSTVKIFNYLKLNYSFQYTKLSGNYYHAGNLSDLSLELTNYCNLHCPECPVGLGLLNRAKGNMDLKLFTKLIDEVAPKLIYLSLYFQGEPYLNKDLFKMIAYANKKKIYTALSTNAQLIDDDSAKKTVESGLDRIIISIDGTTQEIYEKYRIGGNLENVTSATENIVNWRRKLNKKTPYIIHQFLVTKDNENQIPELYKLSKNTGADVVELKTIQINNLEQNNNLLPKNDKYSRYRKQTNGSFSLKKILKNSCNKSWRSMVVTWDGNAVPCCYDKDANYILGNTSANSLNDIFSNSNFHNFRKRILKNRNKIKMCMNCGE